MTSFRSLAGIGACASLGSSLTRTGERLSTRLLFLPLLASTSAAVIAAAATAGLRLRLRLRLR